MEAVEAPLQKPAPETSPTSPIDGFHPVDVVLEPDQETKVIDYLDVEIARALEAHETREKFQAELLRAYKSKPEVERKTFPWDNAANVVAPLVGIAVDAVTARLVKAIFGQKDIVEITIKGEQAEASLEKPLREYLDQWFRRFAAKQIRTVCFDAPLQGDAFVKMVWADKKRIVHTYDNAAEVVQTEKTEFTGCLPHVIPAGDVIWPEGFDEWTDLPWISHRLRYTEAELRKNEKAGLFQADKVDKVLDFPKERDDARYKVAQDSQHRKGRPTDLYVVYEFMGLLEVPQKDTEDTVWEEVLGWYHPESKTLLRLVYNPYFGKARHLIKVPYNTQAHEVPAQGVAELVLTFQYAVSTTINQRLDAASAANCGLVVTTPQANWGSGNQIYPGKRIVTEEPTKDVNVVKLSEPSPHLGGLSQELKQFAQERSGVSAYNLGMESSIVGSQATATGTTAIIGEGNVRFWVSIDDFRTACEEMMYLMLQQEQQFRPQGIPTSGGQPIVLPQGDLRDLLGLRINITSEKVNRDLELQNFQILMQILNEYYARFMQAGAMVLNPSFPPAQKILSMMVMTSAHNIVKRFVERFEVENLDAIVPNLMQALQQAIGVMSGAAGMGQPPGTGQAGPPGIPPAGAPQAGIGGPPGGVNGGPSPQPGGPEIPL